MKVESLAEKRVRVETTKYVLTFRPQDTLVHLVVKGTRQQYLFFPGGACNPVGKRDETLGFGKLAVRKSAGGVEVTLPERSSLWKAKRHTYVCREDSIEVFYELRGRGEIERAHYFRGYVNGIERGMGGQIDEVYSTCPNFQEKLYFHPGESFGLSAGAHLELPVGAQALASPCYCVGLHDRRDKAYLSVGLAAEPGEYTWDMFQWNPPPLIPPTPYGPDGANGGGFAAVYDGKLRINGRWQSPRLVFTFAKNQEEVLRRHLDHCRARGYLPPPPRRKPVDWWLEPIYCTWHDQCAFSAVDAKNPDDIARLPNAFDYCTQALTERWVRRLEREGCKPGTVILDASWAVNLNSGEPDPKKWPAMRSWVEQCHARGMRVFVWSAAWATEGLPPDECITRDGKPVVCDITNPKYVKRFREMIRRWFSDAPDCLNTDGVKMDGLLSLPTGKGLRNHGNVWGLELQRLFLKTLYEAAKSHKPDVCISTFTLNPYLGEYVDMVRIADMYTCRLTAHETMLHRAAMYRVALPHAVIDTDGQLMHYALDDYRTELAEQAKIGVPTLYNAELLYRGRFFIPWRVKPLTREDYREFRKVFAEYRAGRGGRKGRGR